MLTKEIRYYLLRAVLKDEMISQLAWYRPSTPNLKDFRNLLEKSSRIADLSRLVILLLDLYFDK